MPAASSSTPAFTSSSLYCPMTSRSFWVGSTPASVVLSAFSNIMNRMVTFPSCRMVEEPAARSTSSLRRSSEGGGWAPLPDDLEELAVRLDATVGDRVQTGAYRRQKRPPVDVAV